MKLAVSSIAWTNEEEQAIVATLRRHGVDQVEIAPTKLWEDPTVASKEEVLQYVDWWKQEGVTIAAFQSMLFTRPDLTLFDDLQTRKATIEYMQKFIELAATMGAKKLVFGSPKNRQRGDMEYGRAFEIAHVFFTTLAETAADNDVVVCLEPNAPQYNCDFITNAAEGSDLVRSVNHPGFKLHLDTACMALAGDDIADAIRSNSDILEHFHISSPMLDQVEDRPDINHNEAADALKEISYDKLISIEMRPAENGKNIERVNKAVSFVQRTYLN